MIGILVTSVVPQLKTNPQLESNEIKATSKISIFSVGIGVLIILLSWYGSYMTFALAMSVVYIVVALGIPLKVISSTPSLQEKFLKFFSDCSSIPYFDINE